MQRKIINNNLRSRRRLSWHSNARGEVRAPVPQFSHGNRKEFYENGCVFDGVQKRRYLPRSFAIMTNVRRRREGGNVVDPRERTTLHRYDSPGPAILSWRSVHCIAKCADDGEESQRREFPRKIREASWKKRLYAPPPLSRPISVIV